MQTRRFIKFNGAEVCRIEFFARKESELYVKGIV